MGNRRRRATNSRETGDRGTTGTGTAARGTADGAITDFIGPLTEAQEAAAAAAAATTAITNRVGVLLHQIILPMLSARLWAIGIENDYEVPTVKGGAKKAQSERPGASTYLDRKFLGATKRGKGGVDLALFLPGRAELYELKPDHPTLYNQYRSEVNSYTEYFPAAHKWRHAMAPWGRRTWTTPRARIGTSLGPLHAQSRLFDPIVIEGPTMDIIIRFGPPRDHSSGLIVYQEPEVRRRLPGEPTLVQRHHARTVRMLQVNARASAEARAPVVVSQIIIGGSMLLWVAAGLAAVAVEAGVAAMEAAIAAERLARLRAALAALTRAADTAKRVRIAVQTADAVGRVRIATGVAAEAAGGAAELAGATAAEAVAVDEAMAAASEAVAPRVMRVATEVARYYFR